MRAKQKNKMHLKMNVVVEDMRALTQSTFPCSVANKQKKKSSATMHQVCDFRIFSWNEFTPTESPKRVNSYLHWLI